MDTTEYGKLVAKNLRRIMFDAGKTQADVARDLNISKATLSSWMNGTRIPRIKKVDMLCHYFNVRRTDIMEEHDIDDMPARTRNEQEFLASFRKLNADGQARAMAYIDDLVNIEKYTDPSPEESEKRFA